MRQVARAHFTMCPSFAISGHPNVLGTIVHNGALSKWLFSFQMARKCATESDLLNDTKTAAIKILVTEHCVREIAIFGIYAVISHATVLRIVKSCYFDVF